MATYPPHPCGCCYAPPIPYPSPIQIHGGYYPPPPYLAGYCSAPPTYPYTHSAAAYAPPPGFFPVPPPGCFPPPVYSPSTVPYATTSSCPTSEANPIPTQIDPILPPPTPVSVSLLPSASTKTILPSIPASKVTSGGAPAGRTVMDLLPYVVPCTAENARALCTGEMGVGKSCSVVSPTTYSASTMQPDPAPLRLLQDSKVDTVQRHATDRFTNRLPSSVAKAVCAPSSTDDREQDAVQRRATDLFLVQTSFEAIQGQFAKLTEMASQFAVSLGTQSTSENASEPEQSQHISIVPAAPAHVAPQVLGEMPQPYGFHSLDRQSVILADGTKRSYFTLPADYPLERATPPMSPSTCQNVGVMTPLSVAAQGASLTPICCSKTNNTAGSENMMLVHSLQLPMTVQNSHNGLMEMHVSEEDQQETEQLAKFHMESKTASSEQVQVSKPLSDPELHIGWSMKLNTRNFISEQPLKCCSKVSASRLVPDIYVRRTGHEESQGDEKIFWVKSVCQSATGHSISFFPWDLGASAYLVTALKNDSSNDSISNEHVGRLVCSTGGFPFHDKTDLWSQSEHQFAVLRVVFEEVMLDKPPAKPPDRYGIADSLYCNCMLKTEYCPMRCLGEISVSCMKRLQLNPGDFTHMLLVLCVSCREITDDYFADEKLMANTCSKVAALTWHGTLPGTTFILLNSTTYTWDPGVTIFLCSWLNILTGWSATDKQLPCTHITDVAAEPNQSVGSTLLLQFLFIGRKDMVTLTPVGTLIPEQGSSWFNTMQCCQIFEKCIAMSSQLYWQEYINFNGIALWLMHFQPP